MPTAARRKFRSAFVGPPSFAVWRAENLALPRSECHKTCTECLVSLPLTSFEGSRGKCNVCRIKQKRARRAARREAFIGPRTWTWYCMLAPELVADRVLRNKRERTNREKRKGVQKLSDYYVRRCLKDVGFSAQQMSGELIELYRVKLLLHRQIKEM